jgi:hypothetical protein
MDGFVNVPHIFAPRGSCSIRFNDPLLHISGQLQRLCRQLVFTQSCMCLEHTSCGVLTILLNCILALENMLAENKKQKKSIKIKIGLQFCAAV